MTSDPAGREGEGVWPLFTAGPERLGPVNVAPDTFYVKEWRSHHARQADRLTCARPGNTRTYSRIRMDALQQDQGRNSGFFVWADSPSRGRHPVYTRTEVQVLVNLEKPGYFTPARATCSPFTGLCTPDRPHPHAWMRLPAERESLQRRRRMEPLQGSRNKRRAEAARQRKEVSASRSCRPRKG